MLYAHFTEQGQSDPSALLIIDPRQFPELSKQPERVQDGLVIRWDCYQRLQCVGCGVDLFTWNRAERRKLRTNLNGGWKHKSECAAMDPRVSRWLYQHRRHHVAPAA